MATNLGVVLTYHKGLLSIKLYDHFITKHGKLLSYNEGHPSIESHKSLNTLSCEVM